MAVNKINIPKNAGLETRPKVNTDPLAPAHGVGIVLLDARLLVTHQNLASQELLGTSESAHALFGRVKAQDQPLDIADEIQKVIATGQSVRIERLCSRVGDQDTLLSLDCEPLWLNTDEAPAGCVAVIRELTECDVGRGSSAQSGQMATIGALTSRVAHEINNLLDGTLRYVNLALGAHENTDKSKLQNYLEESKAGLLRMVRITRDLLEFVRSRPTPRPQTNIRDIVEDAAKLMDSAARKAGVEIVQRVSDLPLNRPVSAQLFQVFCNLIKNAVDAMPRGGTLHIFAEQSGDDLLIRFQDTGTGLPADVDRLFEPFFTTRPPGQGTGLGLAICRDLVQRCCGGTIAAANRPDGGACFEIRMPTADERAGGGQLVEH